jgi:hypothetical protein
MLGSGSRASESIEALTEVLVGIVPIKVLKVASERLSAVEGAAVTSGGSEIVRLGEATLTRFQVFQPLPFYIGSKVAKLAKAVVGMAVKEPDKRPIS